jgi:uncharacterized membrane protein
MASSSIKVLDRWFEAGLLDAGTAERIRAWETERGEPSAHHRLAAITFGLGGLLLVAGVFLFVSAHWDELSPGARFALVVGMIAAFHVGGAASAKSLPHLSTTLHAAGTAALGAGIFLCGQIFNMAEHWPGALMLWALGAAVSLYLLRDWPHVLWVALLIPAWLWGEWSEAVQPTQTWWDNAAPTVGTVLLALTYISAAPHERAAPWRRVLSHLGAVALIPSCILLGYATDLSRVGAVHASKVATSSELIAWLIALALPFSMAVQLRGKQSLYLLIPLVWALLIAKTGWHGNQSELLLYGLYAIGAAGLVGWGIKEKMTLSVNLGVTGFAITVFAFYFSNIFDKLGRSLGLIGMGFLFLGGGWLMDRARRRLIARIEGNAK